MNSPGESKIARKALRTGLLTLRDGLNEGWRRAADLAIASRLDGLAAIARARVIGVYAAIRSEPDLNALFESWRRRGQQLALPITERGQPLRFCRWQADTVLEADAFGVSVPVERDWVEPDCLIIPCVGFHRAGTLVYRIGYGGGFFDRTLAARPVMAVGVAYDVLETLGFEPAGFDIPLAAVVTESRVIASIASP